MYDLMDGVKVIEVAEHTFVPAAGVLLADWGADVIKVERTVGGGCPSRALRILQRPGQKLNAFFEVANRGKRGITLDLTKQEGRDQLYKLIEGADVFTTNLRGSARKKMGIEPEELMKVNPKLIYARGTGYGMKGAMASHGGFDFPSSWCRSGSAYVQSLSGANPPVKQPGSVGDLCGGATLAGAIAAALFRRERTGKGAIVDHSLYMMGAYIMTQSISGAGLMRSDAEPEAPPAAVSGGDALMREYKTKDDRWLSLCFLNDAWWYDLPQHIGRKDLLEDTRFTSLEDRLKNADQLADELSETFATKTLAEWQDAMFDVQGVWAPHLSPEEVSKDPQALDNGYVTAVQMHDGDTYMSSATPGQFDERPVGELKAGPDYGQHTEEVMRELGLSEQEITALRQQNVIL